jgi:hypothetical protein
VAKRGLEIRFGRQLRAYRGKLETGSELRPGLGEEVFAASFLTRREIVLDEALLDDAEELLRIFAHEVYHFVWRRLSNAERAEWEAILAAEKRPRHAGLSSELRWKDLGERRAGRVWKNYACEAFCDSAAVLFRGGLFRGGLFREGANFSPQRRQWLVSLTKKRSLPL